MAQSIPRENPVPVEVVTVVVDVVVLVVVAVVVVEVVAVVVVDVVGVVDVLVVVGTVDVVSPVSVSLDPPEHPINSTKQIARIRPPCTTYRFPLPWPM